MCGPDPYASPLDNGCTMQACPPGDVGPLPPGIDGSSCRSRFGRRGRTFLFTGGRPGVDLRHPHHNPAVGGRQARNAPGRCNRAEPGGRTSPNGVICPPRPTPIPVHCPGRVVAGWRHWPTSDTTAGPATAAEPADPAHLNVAVAHVMTVSPVRSATETVVRLSCLLLGTRCFHPIGGRAGAVVESHDRIVPAESARRCAVRGGMPQKRPAHPTRGSHRRRSRQHCAAGLAAPDGHHGHREHSSSPPAHVVMSR